MAPAHCRHYYIFRRYAPHEGWEAQMARELERRSVCACRFSPCGLLPMMPAASHAADLYDSTRTPLLQPQPCQIAAQLRPQEGMAPRASRWRCFSWSCHSPGKRSHWPRCALVAVAHHRGGCSSSSCHCHRYRPPCCGLAGALPPSPVSYVWRQKSVRRGCPRMQTQGRQASSAPLQREMMARHADHHPRATTRARCPCSHAALFRGRLPLTGMMRCPDWACWPPRRPSCGCGRGGGAARRPCARRARMTSCRPSPPRVAPAVRAGRSLQGAQRMPTATRPSQYSPTAHAHLATPAGTSPQQRPRQSPLCESSGRRGCPRECRQG